jgi:hypothetical protein
VWVGRWLSMSGVSICGRSAAAGEAARARTRPVGRLKVLMPDQQRQIRALRVGGESVSALVVTFEVSPVTIYWLFAKGLVLAWPGLCRPILNR